jgi:tetratricopeptide (TPR) repeat protein
MQRPLLRPNSRYRLRTAGFGPAQNTPAHDSCGFFFCLPVLDVPLTAAIFLTLSMALFTGCGRRETAASSHLGTTASGSASSNRVIEMADNTGSSPLPDLGDAADPRMAELIAADELSMQGRFADAESAYLALLKKAPDYEEAHFNLGFLYARQGRTNDAIGHYETAIRLVPTYAEAHSNLGNLLVRARRFDEAIQHLQTALAADPKNSRTHNNLGTAFASAGQLTNAIPQFARAVQLNPDFAEAWFNLGRSQLVLDRVDEAIAALQTAVRLEPAMGPAHGQLRKAMERKQVLGY